MRNMTRDAVCYDKYRYKHASTFLILVIIWANCTTGF